MSVYLHFILKMYEWPQKVAFSWTQELRTQNANLPIYQQGQPCAQSFLLTPGSVALPDFRPSSHPTIGTHMCKPQFHKHKSNVSKAQGALLLLCGLLSGCVAMHSVLSFALSSVADQVWNVIFPTLFYPDKSCGFTAHFHSTYNFRMTSSVCSQNSVFFNELFKLLDVQ